MINRKLMMPDKVITAINNKVTAYLSDIEKEKIKNREGKVVYIDGMWYFIDMAGRPVSRRHEGT